LLILSPLAVLKPFCSIFRLRTHIFNHDWCLNIFEPNRIVNRG